MTCCGKGAKFSVVVATYGSADWERRGDDLPYQSAAEQTDDVCRLHLPNGTLAEARNQGAALANHPWLVFLDGDDELAPGYIDAMAAAADRRGRRLLTPRVQYVAGRKAQRPIFHPEVDPRLGNWLVIGTAIHRKVFGQTGGFEEFPIYEDWALFARAQKVGALPVRVEDAVYRAHRRAGSRNHSLDRAGKLAAHAQIHAAVWGDAA